MNRRRVGAATVAALGLAFVARSVPGFLVQRWADGDPGAGPVPLLDTLGGTVTFYSSLASAAEALAAVGIGVALGYWIAGGAEGDDLRTHLRAVGATAAGVLGVVALAVFVWMLGDPAFFVAIVATPVTVAFNVVLGAVAGAGLERFDLLGDDAAGSTGEAPDQSGVDAPR